MSVAVAVDDSVPSQADTLDNLERLILAQAVYELGSDAWTDVSSILSQHPLILQVKRDSATFSPPVYLSPSHSAVQLLIHHTGLPKYLPLPSEYCRTRQVNHHLPVCTDLS
jgi:hypothetical protein